MRKVLLAGLLSALFILAFTGSTFAANGPHRGPGFAIDTGTCAGCHRAHTGSASRLLFQGSNRYQFCTYCHNGSGAQTNVVSGEFEGYSNSPLPAGKRTTTYDGHNSQLDGVAGDGLNGGGFISAVPYKGRSGRIDVPVVLSGNAQRHDVTGNDGISGFAYGGGTTGEEIVTTGTQEIQNFTCTSCHDPHGSKNGDNSERYRILRGGTTDSPVNGLTTVAIKSNESTRFPGDGNPATDDQQKDYTSDSYKEGMADFCIACHTQYKNGMQLWGGLPNPSSPYNAGDGNNQVARFRHAIDVALGVNGNKDGIRGNGASVWANMSAIGAVKLPVEQPNGYSANYSIDGLGDEITCLTCHQSHGTSAQMSASATVAPANTSTLLRLNDRGVCQDCHNK